MLRGGRLGVARLDTHGPRGTFHRELWSVPVPEPLNLGMRCTLDCDFAWAAKDASVGITYSQHRVSAGGLLFMNGKAVFVLDMVGRCVHVVASSALVDEERQESAMLDYCLTFSPGSSMLLVPWHRCMHLAYRV